MKTINSMVFGMAALVLMAGCSGVPKVKDVSGPSEIIEHKGTIFGVAQPEWVSEVLEAPDQKSLKKALGIDRHIWVISKTGENLDFIKNWADQVDARAEISASIQQGVADFTGARMQGEDSDVEETIERYSARASNIIISGLNKETDWWVRGYTRIQKKNEQEALYTYIVVYSMDEDLYQKQIKKAFNGENDKITQELVEYLMNYTVVSAKD